MMQARRRTLATAFALIVASMLSAGAGRAQSTAALDPEKLAEIRDQNAKCFSCHSPAGLKSPPRQDMDLARLGTMLHDPALYETSSHGRVECRTCHGVGATTFPHGADLKKQVSPCSECHAAKVFRIETQFEASVHAKTQKDKFTCWSCHDGHVYNVAAKIGAPRKIIAQDNAMCLDCHNSDLQFSKFAPVEKRRPNIDAIHEWLPNTRLHWQAVRCVDCHTPAARGFSHEILDKSKAEKNCVACHSQESALRTRLYRHLVAEEQEQLGFVNSVFLSTSYVIGASRNPWIDRAVGVAAALLILGMLGHAALRIGSAWWRRRGRRPT
ncbi:cytochrome c3 family protein [Rhodoplanes roseus]|uniref:Class III cytochrome C domain-containing protein n=1 Tax=Rhodoplanes roseus TaxID=29409 RepID=A0A327L066_9BRAD|nr:cytochrome c3 family protein [Rhodoplanes roseus]RAI44329.1 hypothetical protein CH341_09700 [Rhodoplanes roseus]